jgi:hypothetical protein
MRHVCRAMSCMLFMCLAGCDGVSISTLYAREIDLCSEENADLYAERVASCRAQFLADGSCAGVFSFTGVLLDEPVTLDTDLLESSLLDQELPDLSIVRDRVQLQGESPYFRFVLLFYLLGGAEDLGATQRELTIGGSMNHPPGWSTDAFARADLRITAPPDSSDLAISSGNVVITTQTQTESAGTFVLERGEATSLSGCFHAFTNSRMIESEDP